MNKFKGLDLVDRVPEELWTKVCDIVQEAVIKTIPNKKKRKKAKWLSEEALQIAEKREAKGKGCSVAKSCPTLCDPMDSSMSGSFVLAPDLNFLKKLRLREVG